MNPIDGRSITAAAFFEVRASAFNQSLIRLATGRRINRGADDPAGMIVANNLRATLAALEAESKSLERTDHVAMTADGALGEMSSLLIEAEALAVANQNIGGLSEAEIAANQQQIDSILASVERLASHTTFAGTPLFDGNLALSAGDASHTIAAVSLGTIGEVEVDAEMHPLQAVTSGGGLDTTKGGAEAAHAQRSIRAAITDIATRRGALGAFQSNTVQARLSVIETSIANTAAAESTIADTEYAREIAELNRQRTLSDISILRMRDSLDFSQHVLRLLE